MLYFSCVLDIPNENLTTLNYTDISNDTYTSINYTDIVNDTYTSTTLAASNGTSVNSSFVYHQWIYREGRARHFIVCFVYFANIIRRMYCSFSNFITNSLYLHSVGIAFGNFNAEYC